MGTYSHLWSMTKKNVMAVLLGITISDRYVTLASVTGESMHPTFTAANNVLQGDFVLAEKRCLEKYEFSHGDVILFKCPSNHKELFVKRLIALPGEWVQLPGYPKVTKIPEGHCWVEGDNAARSWDSRAFGPIPLGLVEGRVTHIIWPPSKISQVERKMPEGRIFHA
ncbi:mitochondrial inner membrane protease subunit 2-like isoform X1 [Panicum virgatum]|uniref:Mitochondrial inner membrane protease subunit 2 n=1 Tax=Panicum virgatum TaxID=38727 RepID=A0A8T0NZ95_PANVG|nr:mitochondrial inner membrane protease subunit 2-like isoform X1 [Panicum virgatum]KAG2554763.1 hypothetical protein PVAP13_9KG588000 [Panicum virgatum]